MKLTFHSIRKQEKKKIERCMKYRISILRKKKTVAFTIVTIFKRKLMIFLTRITQIARFSALITHKRV